MIERIRIAVVIGGLTVAALAPIGFAHDSFPLSTFPMFSRARPLLVTIDRVMEVDAQGERPVPPSVVASGEVLQAKVAIARATSRPGGAKALCSAVASRLVGRSEGTELLVVRDELPVPDYLEHNEPKKRTVLARCKP